MSDSGASSSLPPAAVVEGFWRLSPEAKKGLGGLTVARGAALQHLGASPFTKTGFPILGLLETVYEHVVTHAPAGGVAKVAGGGGDAPVGPAT